MAIRSWMFNDCRFEVLLNLEAKNHDPNETQNDAGIAINDVNRMDVDQLNLEMNIVSVQVKSRKQEEWLTRCLSRTWRATSTLEMKCGLRRRLPRSPCCLWWFSCNDRVIKWLLHVQERFFSRVNISYDKKGYLRRFWRSSLFSCIVKWVLFWCSQLKCKSSNANLQVETNSSFLFMTGNWLSCNFEKLSNSLAWVNYLANNSACFAWLTDCIRSVWSHESEDWLVS